MYKKLVFFSLFSVLLSCNQSEKPADPITDNVPAVAAKPEPKKISAIQGPAGTIYVDDNGAGEGIPVVFAHSFGGSSAHWKEQLVHLRPGRRAVAFDFRGNGQSQAPADRNFSAEALAADIAAVVDNLALPRFVLIGHSMGGSAAIAYAGAHPNRVAGLLLVGTPGKGDPAQSKKIIAALESDQYDKVMGDYMNQLLTGAKPNVDTLVRADMRQVSKENSISIIKALFQFDPLPVMNRYKGPKLIVYTPREDQPTALYRQVPGADNKVVANTSHWIQLDKPGEFNGIMDVFLQTVEKK